jgi:ribosomal protein S18 acetylase RimI-like enzyme
MVFEGKLGEYSILRLEPGDIPALQSLFEKCQDYAMIVEGESASPNAAEDIFNAAPPGRSLEDKFIFGLVDQQGETAGVLEGMRDYPGEATWWIGLLLLAPEARGRGSGQRLVQRFMEYVRSQGGERVMLGVVEDNTRALSFWQRLGFTQVRVTEPRRFGKKTQAVYEMQQDTAAEDISMER